MLGHPTGRLLLSREPYAVDMMKVIDAASREGTVIEINAHPQRLDLDWRMCQYAREKGVKVSIESRCPRKRRPQGCCLWRQYRAQGVAGAR